MKNEKKKDKFSDVLTLNKNGTTDKRKEDLSENINRRGEQDDGV